jgi:hypothetical protein
MLLTRAQLSIRPTYREGESLAGYVYRLYSANGHRLPVDVVNQLRSLYRGHPLRFVRDAFDAIQRIVGFDHELSHERWVQRHHGLGISDKWERWIFEADVEFRYCPSCIQSFGHYLRVWELKFVSVCPVHHCQLIKRCPGCKQPFSWQTLDIGWTCSCGQSLEMASPLVVPRQFSALSRYVCQSWDVDLPEGYPLEPSRDPSSLILAYRKIYHLALLRGLIVSIYRNGSDDIVIAKRYARERVKRSSFFLGKQLQYSDFETCLRKLSYIRWRDCNSMLIYIASDSREMAVVRFMVTIGQDLPQCAYLEDCVSCFLASFSISVGLVGLTLFNPRYALAGRWEVIAKFAKWVMRQFGKSHCLPPDRPQALRANSSGDEKERTAINLVNGLIKLSRRNVKCKKNLRELVNSCLFPDGVHLDGAGLLRDIALRFMKLPDNTAAQLETVLRQHLTDDDST